MVLGNNSLMRGTVRPGPFYISLHSKAPLFRDGANVTSPCHKKNNSVFAKKRKKPGPFDIHLVRSCLIICVKEGR